MTDISGTIFRGTVELEAIRDRRGLQDGAAWVPRLVWCPAEVFYALLWCWGQTLIPQMPNNLHQLLIYIDAASGEIKHVNMVTNHTLLPTALGRILMGWKLHLQLNFIRLHLEIEQSYQAGKLVKWCISSACIYPASKIVFCAGKYVKCEFYVCNFCSINLNPIDFVIKTIRKEIWEKKS